MKESTFNQAVNKLIKKPLIAWKIIGAPSGTPDNQYMGADVSLWAEFKYDHKLPAVLDLTKPDKYLSALQQKYLRHLHHLGHPVCVVYGWDIDHGVIIDGLGWERPLQTSQFVPLTKRQIAAEITRRLTADAWPTPRGKTFGGWPEKETTCSKC